MSELLLVRKNNSKFFQLRDVCGQKDYDDKLH